MIWNFSGVFRTLSNAYDELFCKNSYLAHISASTFKIFPEKRPALIKFHLFYLKRDLLLYFQKWNPVLFSPSSKNKEDPPRENFSRERFSYTSRNGGPGKTSYIFSKESFSYILENENSEKTPYISGNIKKLSETKK